MRQSKPHASPSCLCLTAWSQNSSEVRVALVDQDNCTDFTSLILQSIMDGACSKSTYCWWCASSLASFPPASFTSSSPASCKLTTPCPYSTASPAASPLD